MICCVGVDRGFDAIRVVNDAVTYDSTILLLVLLLKVCEFRPLCATSIPFNCIKYFSKY